MIRRCGDVFEVNFGYRRGYKQEGLRPAIIVQADYYCELLTLWVIPMVLCPRWAICLTTLVRLKAAWSSAVSSETSCFNTTVVRLKAHQFHVYQQDVTGFNTTVVRLKDGSKDLRRRGLYCFNTTVVRLKGQPSRHSLPQVITRRQVAGEAERSSMISPPIRGPPEVQNGHSHPSRVVALRSCSRPQRTTTSRKVASYRYLLVKERHSTRTSPVGQLSV